MTETVSSPVTTTEQVQETQDPIAFLSKQWGKPVEENQDVPRGTSGSDEPGAAPDTGNKKDETPAFDPIKWLEEQTEGKIKSVDELKGVLTKEPEYKPIEFQNDTSRNIYEAILGGKEDVLEEYYTQKGFVKRLKDAKPEDVVKAYIKEQYPTFTEQERDYFFNKEFGFNEDAFEDDEIGKSVEKKKVEQKILAVQNQAIDYFSKKAEAIKLPEIQKQTEPAQPGLDLDSEPAKQVAALVENLRSNLEISGNEIPFEYSNEDNGALVKGKFTFDEKALSEFEEKVGEMPDVYWAKTYLKNDEFDSKLFAKHQYILANLSNILQAATSEGYNQGVLQKVRNDKNIVLEKPIGGDAPETTDKVEIAKDYKWRGFPKDFIIRKTGIDPDTIK